MGRLIKRSNVWRAAMVLGAMWAGIQGFAGPGDTTQLRPKPVFGKEAKMIVSLLEGYHFRKMPLNDSLSSVIFDQYLSELDNSKSYLLASDIKSFERYRYKLDDFTRAENLEAPFEMYRVFMQRYRQRIDYVLKHLIDLNHDFTVDEYYDIDRAQAPWATSVAELNEIWRLIVKNQALTLKMAGRSPEDIKKTLRNRFERIQKTLAQTKPEDVFSEYMNAVTTVYDPHTNYLLPRNKQAFDEDMSLSLEGIGARLQTDNDYTRVVEIVPGGPADKSSLLHVNDLIAGVAQGKDGEMVDVVGWRIDEVVKLIKGPKGTTVRLAILPAKTGAGGPITEIAIVRDKVKLEDQAAKKRIVHVQQDGKPMKLGVITLPSFYMDFAAYNRRDPDYRSTTKDVKKLIGELQQEGVDGLVLDLRNNGGGSLMEAVDLTGLFIRKGPVVQTKTSQNRVEVYRDEDAQVLYTGPLVVLINRFSASASEIFAGAIQDYQRGVVVGETSYGKGTVQSVIDLDRYIPAQEPVGSLKITFQKFYRVTGSSTQHKGVSPDINLPSAFDADQFGESALKTALPWDVIPSTPHQKVAQVNPRVLADLTKSFEQRLKTDVSLKKYQADTETLRQSLKEGRVTLNEQKRKSQQANQDELATRIPDREVTADTDLTRLKDEFLREGLLILGELITKRIG